MQQKLFKYISIIVGSLLLMSFAFSNGFPVLCPDSSTYIVSGFEFKPPFDRPITYGIFIWLTSLGGQSLWLTIFAQSFLLSFLIRLMVASVAGNTHTDLKFLLVIAVLSFFTPLSWISSMLMSDVFTPICCLSLILMLTAKNNFNRRILISLYALFFLANAMHMSNVLISITTILISLVYQFFTKTLSYKTHLISLVLAISGIAVMGSAVSKSKYIFIAGSMVETGIMKELLATTCDQHQYKLCAYQDSLNMSAVEFLWEEKSPLMKLGGWQANKDEMQQLVEASLADPHFILLHIKAAFSQSLKQLFMFDTGEGSYSFANEITLKERIGSFIPSDLSRANKAVQFNEGILTISAWRNNMLSYSVVLFFVGAFVLLIYKLIATRHVDTTSVLLLITMFVNTVICATLANPSHRLGGRMLWIPALICFILVFRNLLSKEVKPTR